MAQMTELHRRVLRHLRELRNKYGNCYHELDAIAEAVGCDPDKLFETEDNTGVLADLEWDGSVMRAGTDFIAVGSMDWE